MAIIKCPTCGKQITDRMEKCPHCNAILKDSVKKNHEVDKVKVTIADNIVGIITALIFTFVIIFLKRGITISLSAPFGDMAVVATSISYIIYFQKSFIILIIEAVLLCSLSVLLNKKVSSQFVVGVILTIVLGIAGYLWQNIALNNNIGLFIKKEVLENVLGLAKSISFNYGFVFAILLGSLSLMSFGKKIKNSIIVQFISAIGYFILSYILEYVFLCGFNLNFRIGWLIASVFSAILILGFAALTNKGFQQLLTPKQIS